MKVIVGHHCDCAGHLELLSVAVNQHNNNYIHYTCHNNDASIIT